MKKSVLNSFKKIYLKIDNLSSYKNYYNALRYWVKENEKYFWKELQSDSRMRMLLNLEEDKYLVENPGISLVKERYRLCNRIFPSLDTMLRSIGDTLWDMVTIRSDKNCPYCNYGLGYGYGDLRYIKVKSNDGNFNIMLECNICDGLVNIDGSPYEGKVESYSPACKDDLKT